MLHRHKTSQWSLLFHWMLGIVLVITTPVSIAKKLYYRYTNAEGMTVIHDSIEPEFLSQGYQVFNENGLLVETVPPVKSQEELVREQQLNLEQQQKEQQRQEAAARDRVLLRTFSSVEDIMRARDNKLAALDTIIEITQGNIQRLEDQLQRFNRKAADLERNGKKVPEFYPRTIKETRRQINNNKEFIETKIQEKLSITRSADNDVKRFKMLHHQLDSSEDENQSHGRMSQGFPICNDVASCNRAWSLAQVYVQMHATTPVLQITPEVIKTALPVIDDDIGLTVTKVVGPNNETTLRLEALCFDSPTGQALCDSPVVNKIQQNFYTTISTVTQPSG